MSAGMHTESQAAGSSRRSAPAARGARWLGSGDAGRQGLREIGAAEARGHQVAGGAVAASELPGDPEGGGERAAGRPAHSFGWLVS